MFFWFNALTGLMSFFHKTKRTVYQRYLFKKMA